MIKNALRIGKLLALSSLLSMALTVPAAVINAGTTALADAAGSVTSASLTASAGQQAAAPAEAKNA